METNLARKGLWRSASAPGTGGGELVRLLDATDQLGLVQRIDAGPPLGALAFDVIVWVCSRWRERGEVDERHVPFTLQAMAEDLGWRRGGGAAGELTRALDTLRLATVRARVYNARLGETRIDTFGLLDRWERGEPDRPGRPARPGSLVLGDWLHEQLCRKHVTFVSWAELRALPLLALLALAGGWTSSARASSSPVNPAALDEWMADEVPGSVGLGQVFVAEGVRNGLDPRALVAIARHESVLGTQGSGAGIHNAFGWGPAIAFSSWEENIATVARGLARNYVGRGRATLAEIQPIWAPEGATNDPGDLNSDWVEAVGRFYSGLGGDPALPITLEAQGGALGAGPTIGPEGLATPTGGVGTVGGGPGEGTHSYGALPNNWQSDHAVDIGLPFGSPLYAIDAGVIVRIGGDPTDFSGRFGGAQLTVVSADDAYYYAHLSGIVMREGERVALGQLIGFSGAANGTDHLHLGVLRRDPVALAGLG